MHAIHEPGERFGRNARAPFNRKNDEKYRYELRVTATVTIVHACRTAKTRSAVPIRPGYVSYVRTIYNDETEMRPLRKRSIDASQPPEYACTQNERTTNIKAYGGGYCLEGIRANERIGSSTATRACLVEDAQ